MTYNEFKECIINVAKKYELKEYELYYQSSESCEVSTYIHEIDGYSSNVSGGVCFRCIVDGKMGYASTELLNEDSAEKIVSDAIDNAKTIENEEKVFISDGSDDYKKIQAEGSREVSTEELIKTALECQDTAYAESSMVVDGTSTAAIYEKSRVSIYNSNGLDLENEQAIYGVIPQIIADNGSEKSSAFSFEISNGAPIDSGKIVKETVKEAVSMFGADSVKTGVYDVVIGPKAMIDLLNTYKVIFSSENAQRGLSLLKGKEGETVASECVTVIDDPFCEMSPVKSYFDAEGSAARYKEVIKDGKLTTLLYNLQTASVAGVKTTGNASKASYSSSISVSPFSFYIAPSETSEEEMFEKVKDGVYINQLQGLHAGANVITGDFSIQSAGYVIKDGKLDAPVKSFTIAGNFYDFLKKIKMTGNNLRFGLPRGFSVIGSPSVLAEGISVAGK